MKSVREWIKENFPHNDNWDEDNCFFFSLILRERFEGKIYYDVVNNYTKDFDQWEATPDELL